MAMPLRWRAARAFLSYLISAPCHPRSSTLLRVEHLWNSVFGCNGGLEPRMPPAFRPEIRVPGLNAGLRGLYSGSLPLRAGLSRLIPEFCRCIQAIRGCARAWALCVQGVLPCRQGFRACTQPVSGCAQGLLAHATRSGSGSDLRPCRVDAPSGIVTARDAPRRMRTARFQMA